ncbi:MAG: hypothetical protein NUW01_05965 [Gemmatimonadaceae bacterium]|nr:hypothetical protein [Gemmatimonadaceae bacterium]
MTTQTDDAIGVLLTGSVPEVTPAIKESTDPAFIRALVARERASDAPRSGIIVAAQLRLGELLMVEEREVDLVSGEYADQQRATDRAAEESVDYLLPGGAFIFGFDPLTEYVIRARNWDYQGTTERFRFANGQAIAAAMRPDATAEQITARSERMARIRDTRKLKTNADGQPDGTQPTYAIYVRGTEPDVEPMWRGQAPPEGVEPGTDTGEETPEGQWRAEPQRVQRGTGEEKQNIRRGLASAQVAEATARVFHEDTGEATVRPDAHTTTTRWRSADEE